MRRLCCALAALAVLLTACSGEEPASTAGTPTTEVTARQEPEPTPAPGQSVTEEATPEPTEQSLAPLTGLPVDAAVLERRVLAVKIDNAPRARPQIGLQEADVVVEELVEGGVTRFLALYQSTDPGTVGPVRSGREVDALLLPSFAPLVAMSGAHQTVQVDFNEAGLNSVEEGQVSGWSRFKDRPRPHNLFLNAPLLWEAASEQPAAQPAWTFGETPSGGESASVAALRFPAASSTWTWDADAGNWRRDQDGAPHLVRDAFEPEDRQITTENVVIVRVSVRPGDRTDSSGTPTVDIAAIGEGDMTVLRDGQSFTGRWRKPAPDEPYEWLDNEGEPLPLAPGRTWIELLPTDSGLQITQ